MRAQQGINLLIVFLVTVLIAALASAVLLSTAHRFKVRAATASSDTLAQVTEGVTVLDVYGVSQLGTEDNNVTQVAIRVRLAPGSPAIELNDIQIVVPLPDGSVATYTLDNNWNTTDFPSTDSRNTPTFTVDYIVPTLADDRYLEPGEVVELKFQLAGQDALVEGESRVIKLVIRGKVIPVEVKVPYAITQNPVPLQ